jgi:hypothetical protein
MTGIVTSPVTITGTKSLDASTSTFTPGAAFAIDAAAQIINAAWSLGNTKNSDFETKVAAITSAIQALIDGATLNITASQASAVAISEPTVTIPTAMGITDITGTFDSETTSLINLLAGKVTSFMADYFPNDSADFAAAESWIAGALANPHGGLPTAVAAQLITDDQNRAMAEATRASDSVLATFAARRFPLPPGAAASAVLQIQQKAQDVMAESSRKITIASVEMMKFAIDNALKLRQIAISSVMDYTKTMALGPQISSQMFASAYDAQSHSISAVSSYYGARTEAKKVISSVDQFNAAATQSASEKNQAAQLSLIEDKIKALMVEVQAIAQITTALFNNVHANAGTGYSVSGSS